MKERDLAELRREYAAEGLCEDDLPSDPLAMFRRWMHDAVTAGLHEPNAMVVATVSSDGAPSARMVLLKGLDERGFCFYTNYSSRKAGELAAYKAEGINIVAPPIFALLDVDGSGNIIPSSYAMQARGAGLNLITWSLERSGILADGDNGFYYQTFDPAIRREGDVMKVLDVLNREVGVLGIFSDWPATVSYYANCMNIK